MYLNGEPIDMLSLSFFLLLIYLFDTSIPTYNDTKVKRFLHLFYMCCDFFFLLRCNRKIIIIIKQIERKSHFTFTFENPICNTMQSVRSVGHIARAFENCDDSNFDHPFSFSLFRSSFISISLSLSPTDFEYV